MIWDFNRVVSGRLAAWNVINIVVGLVLIWRGGFWRGFGSQHIGWGVINLAIAFFGGRATEARWRSLPDVHAPEVLRRESRNLRRLLWINAGLDVLYMLGGWWTARTRTDVRWRGIGWGIVLQGGLLWLFDVIHALLAPKE